MRIIIAPAKKMLIDTDNFSIDALPAFLEQSEQLKTTLQGMSPNELKALWKCNDAIAKLNVERLACQLASERDFVLNLASKEYSRAVEPHLPKPVGCSGI